MILKNALKTIPELTFRHLSDEAGDSCTFLNFFLPTKKGAENAAAELGASGIGAAYWYTNMYHFINQWDHVHNLSTISKIPLNVLPKVQDYSNLDLPKSQDVVGRLISVGVSSAKSVEEIEELASKMLAIIKKHV